MASPSVSPAGIFRKLGTEVYLISGTLAAVAFCCAAAGPAASTSNRTDSTRFMIGLSLLMRRDVRHHGPHVLRERIERRLGEALDVAVRAVVQRVGVG